MSENFDDVKSSASQALPDGHVTGSSSSVFSRFELGWLFSLELVSIGFSARFLSLRLHEFERGSPRVRGL